MLHGTTKDYKDIAEDMSYVVTFTCLLGTPKSNVFLTCRGDIPRHVFCVLECRDTTYFGSPQLTCRVSTIPT